MPNTFVETNVGGCARRVVCNRARVDDRVTSMRGGQHCKFITEIVPGLQVESASTPASLLKALAQTPANLAARTRYQRRSHAVILADQPAPYRRPSATDAAPTRVAGSTACAPPSRS